MRIHVTKAAVFLAVGILLTGGFIGCTKGPKGAKEGDTVLIFRQGQGETLAQVGQTKLTLEELRDDFLQRQGSFRGSPNLNTEKARTDFIESQVVQEAMFLKAIELGYFDRPEVKRQTKKDVVQRFVRDQLEAAQARFIPTDDQMKDHYDKNPNFYNRSEAVKVAYIAIPFGSNKAKSKEIADAMHKDAAQTVKSSNTREFSRIAMKHAQQLATLSKASVETNETDYLDKAGFEAKFGESTFDKIKDESNIGEIRNLLTTDTAFIIMMKTGLRKALNESFEEAKPKITKRLAYEGRNNFYKELIEKLKTEYKISVNQERLAELSNDPHKEKMAKNEAAEAPATGQPPQSNSDAKPAESSTN